ncbi:MAG: TMEM165/GDT1 family protein [Acidimicrobiales bacterium]
MSIHTVLVAFATIFPAELPDKSMFSTIVLVARYRRPAWVWAGATAAFVVHVVVAAAAGRALSLLPDAVVSAVVAVLFALGAVLLVRAGRRAADGGDDEAADAAPTSPWAAAAGSFGVIALVEWGDLTQIATAGLAARTGEPVAVGLGALAALAAVAGLAAAFGRQLVARVPLHLVNFVGAAVFAALALWTVIELLT